jgi:hypothetical protein
MSVTYNNTLNETPEFKKTIIFEHVNDLSISDKIQFIEIIFKSPFRNKLKEKGNGIQVKINSLSDDIINELFKFINLKMDEYKL